MFLLSLQLFLSLVVSGSYFNNSVEAIIDLQLELKSLFYVIQYSRACGSYKDFLDRGLPHKTKD
jgi:hypothetical protein